MVTCDTLSLFFKPRILLMHQAGLLDHALRTAKENDNKNPCSINKKNNNRVGQQDGEPITLKLPDISAAFFILGIGMTFAFLILIGEFIVRWIAR